MHGQRRRQRDDGVLARRDGLVDALARPSGLVGQHQLGELVGALHADAAMAEAALGFVEQ